MTPTSPIINGTAHYTLNVTMEHISQFIAELPVKDSTRVTYMRNATAFATWLEQTNRDINMLTAADMAAYKNDIERMMLAPLTQCAYLTTVKSFYSWLDDNGIYPNIAKKLKKPTRTNRIIKQHLTVDQVHAMLDAIDNVRDAAIANVMFRNGLRDIEVSRLDIEDITFINGKPIMKLWRKGHVGKDSYTPLSAKTYDILMNYIRTCRCGARGAEPLFVSQSNHATGCRLTTKSISRIIKNALRDAGMDNAAYSAHSLRHTFAVQLLKNNAPLYDVQMAMGHANPTTTELYLKTIEDERRMDNPIENMLDAI